MAYLDPEDFEIKTNENGLLVSTGYFDNGIGVRLEQREEDWSVTVMTTEGWPEVKFKGDYVDGEPETFEELDNALSYIEQIQAL
jgi:hypothetical protein